MRSMVRLLIDRSNKVVGGIILQVYIKFAVEMSGGLLHQLLLTRPSLVMGITCQKLDG